MELGELSEPPVHVVNTQFRLCTHLVPRPTIVAFDLGMRLNVRLCTKLENGVLHNGHPPQSVVNGFLNQGKFGAMKTLNGWEVVRCDEHQFHAKIKVST